MVDDAVSSDTPDESREFAIISQIRVLTKEFFKNDAPILDTRRGEVMYLKTVVEDHLGSINLTLRDKACYEYFQLTVNKFRELWEEGVDNPDRQDAILGSLNARAAAKVLCLCKAEVWRARVQINVNVLEIMDAVGS